MVEIEADVKPFMLFVDRAERRLESYIKAFLDEAGRLAALEEKSLAPRRTGFLADSIGYQADEASAIIGPSAPYAIFVEKGTKPHTIEARGAEALFFEINGRSVFALRVKHPGTRPAGFVRATVESLRSKIEALAERFVREALR